MTMRIAIASAFLLSAPPADAAEDVYRCAASPEVVAPCFTIRGRLSFWNGAPSARIWPVGTKRLLGIRHDVLPPSLRAEIASFDTELFADFRVCPFTKSEPGHMQFVCIESWRNPTARQRPQ